MHPSPRSLIRVTFTAVCVLTLTAVTAGVSVAQGSSSGSTGSSALSGSSGQGSANAPGSAALNPSNPYSEDTTDNLVTFGDSFTANTHSVANNIESSAEDYPQQSGCHIALDAWPGLLAEDTAARETAVQDFQRNVADRTGVEFIDIREMTLEKNSTCGLDHERYVAGVLDVTTPQFNMHSHPSRAGSEFLAGVIGEHLSS